MRIRIVYTGRSYQTAEALPDEIVLADGARVAEALRRICEHLPEGEELAETCLVSVSGQHLGNVASHVDRELADGDELLLIAPVAGG